MEVFLARVLTVVACLGAVVLPVMSASAATDAGRAFAPVRVVAKISTGAGPCIATPVRGRIWVSNFNGWTLARVDPRTNRRRRPPDQGRQAAVRARLRGGERVGRSLRDAHGRAGSSDTGSRRRIVIGGTPYDVAFYDGSLWATSASAGAVVRVDPRTNRVVARIFTGGTPANLTAAFGSLWAGSATGTAVFRIDTETTPSRVSRPGARDPGRSSPSGTRSGSLSQGSNTVAKIDPNRRAARDRARRDCPAWLADAGDGTLLVPNARTDTVSRIDTMTNR